MSNKPPKKSDVNKRWRKPRRDRGSRISPEYHLIITEGSKTEPLYFEGLKKAVNQKYSGRIEIVGLGEGANTLTILDKAEKEQLRSGGKYRHIWIVHDKDDFPEDDFDNAYFRCQELSSSSDTVTYHALWSNECIELWFLLHFEYLQSNIHRDLYYPKLTKHLGSKYKKNSSDMFEVLYPHLDEAIRNAKKLLQNYPDGSAPSQCAPGTSVYSYVEKVLCYFRDRDKFAAFKTPDLKDYAKFKGTLIDFRSFYSLDQYNLKEIDKYMWQFGKEYFPKNYGKKKKDNN